MLWREWHRNRPSKLGRRLWATLLIICWSIVAWGTYEMITGFDRVGSSSLDGGLRDFGRLWAVDAQCDGADSAGRGAGARQSRGSAGNTTFDAIDRASQVVGNVPAGAGLGSHALVCLGLSRRGRPGHSRLGYQPSVCQGRGTPQRLGPNSRGVLRRR